MRNFLAVVEVGPLEKKLRENGLVLLASRRGKSVANPSRTNPIYLSMLAQE